MPAAATDVRRDDWAHDLVGQVIGERFRLDRMIEVGGMGAVFESEVLESGERVAIKVLVPGLLHAPHAVERLRREARRAAEAEHPGIVEVREFVPDPERGAFLVMELLEGESLSDRLYRQDRLTPEVAIEMAARMLEILDVVHRRGVLHRDLKPGNLFLSKTADGAEELKILDFGLARSLDPEAHETTLTVPGTVVGTPRYMAPEQARAERKIDHRADIYSVGAVLYRCLSGKQPYAEWGSREVILAVRAGPCVPLRDVAPTVPRALARVVERAMRLDPDERFEDAAAMREALLTALDRVSVVDESLEETLEERVTLPERESGERSRAETVRAGRPLAERESPPLAAAPAPKRSVALALAAALSLALVAALAYSVWSSSPEDADVAEARVASPPEPPAEVEPPSPPPPVEDPPDPEPSAAEPAPVVEPAPVEAVRPPRRVRSRRTRPVVDPAAPPPTTRRSGPLSRDQF